MIMNKRLLAVILSCLVISSILLTSSCSRSYSGSSANYGTTSDYSSDDNSYDSSSDNDEEYVYDEDSDIDSDEESNYTKKRTSDITNNVAKKTKNSNKTAKTVTKTNESVTKTNKTVTKTNKDYDNSDWLHKDYYNYGNSIGEAEFGTWYDRAPITRKPYTTFDDIPDSDILCVVNSGEHYFRLGETNKSASLVYCKGYTGYLTDAYTSSDTYYDHQFTYNAPGVTLKKYNNEWVAYKNGPVTDYCGICPYEGTYWLISQGKVRTDISTIIHVYYDEGNNQKEAYLVIDEGEMVAIKSANNIVLWSNY